MLILLLIPLVMVVRADECPTVKAPTDELHHKIMQTQLQFSADLLQTVAKEKAQENVILSPTSIRYALLETYFSAGGKLVATLRKALRIPEEQEIDKGLLIGDRAVTQHELEKSASKEFELNIANRIYVADSLNVKDCMKKLLPNEIQQANFSGDADGALKEINSWVAKETKNLIPKFLPNDFVTPDTEIVLVNAAYLNGTWVSKFSINDTKQDKFNLANGSNAPVTMMSQTAIFKMRYDSQLEADILELPYKGDDLSMFILLPNKTSASTIPDLLGKVTGETLYSAFKETYKVQEDAVEVYIPKFTVEQELNLIPTLTTMGAGDLFRGKADFSTLFEKNVDIKVNKAIHKATFKVNEEGTEAAAATAIGGLRSTGPGSPVFRADHPFIYAVYSKATELLLFTGVFNSPK